MTRACGADDIKNILYPALFRKLRFQMIDDNGHLREAKCQGGDDACGGLRLNNPACLLM